MFVNLALFTGLLALLHPNEVDIVGGDFNASHPSWCTKPQRAHFQAARRGDALLAWALSSGLTVYTPKNATHRGGSTIDLFLLHDGSPPFAPQQPSLSPVALSDHYPVVLTLDLNEPRRIARAPGIAWYSTQPEQEAAYLTTVARLLPRIHHAWKVDRQARFIAGVLQTRRRSLPHRGREYRPSWSAALASLSRKCVIARRVASAPMASPADKARNQATAIALLHSSGMLPSRHQKPRAPPFSAKPTPCVGYGQFSKKT